MEHAGQGDKKRIQAEYDEMIASKNEEVTVAKEACIKLTEARNRLLPKLMNGEIEV